MKPKMMLKNWTKDPKTGTMVVEYERWMSFITRFNSFLQRVEQFGEPYTSTQKHDYLAKCLGHGLEKVMDQQLDQTERQAAGED